MNKRFWIILALLLMLVPAAPVCAQDSDLPIYVVQPGDTINLISIRFNVSAADLIAVNELSNPDILPVGARLKIPGYEGVSGEISTQVVELGQNLARLSRAVQISSSALTGINRITSPNEMYAGSTIIVPINSGLQPRAEIPPIDSGQSLLEFAVRQDANLWTLASLNQKSRPSSLLPNEPLFSTTGNPEYQYWSSGTIKDIQVSPLPLVQGKTITVKIKTSESVTIDGELAGKQLHFFTTGENEWIALQGIHAMAEPGLADFSLDISSSEAEPFSFSQPLLLESGYYPKDPALYVDPQTIDTAITKPEDEMVLSTVNHFTPEKYWSGVFHLPVDEPICIKSWFGNRRSYNGSPFTYFHTGVDYGVCASLNIYSPAAGVVVFADMLTVRGNATFIDHGSGVYSGIFHQKSIAVNVGDRVEAGQLIGEIGDTGRVTGPHLHWEMWVNGIQVEPLDWLELEFP